MKKNFSTLKIITILFILFSTQTSHSWANINEVVLSDCFRDVSDNFMFRLLNKGNKFVVNKNSNSLVEIKSSGKDSIIYKLSNFSSKFAEGNREDKTETNNQTTYFTNVKLYFETKKVEINYKSTYIKSGKKVNEDGGTYIYNCRSIKQ